MWVLVALEAVLGEYLLVVAAAFVAGVLNTIAGGGSFLTFPALVIAGLPPIVANATSAATVFPGYLGGVVGFRREIGTFPRTQLIGFVSVALAGGLIGSALLLVSSNETFSIIIPFLLLLATLLFLFGEHLRNWAAERSIAIVPFGLFGLFVVSVYGGYFNGGLGIILLALFTLWGMTDLHAMNGLKSGLSFAISMISVLTYVIAGLVDWYYAIGMIAAASVGGYAGAPLARILPLSVVRAVIAIIGFATSAVFFWRLLGG